MEEIYKAWYVCLRVSPFVLIDDMQYNTVLLGLRDGNGSSDIVVGATSSRFVVGREYCITISEMPIIISEIP